MSRIRSRRVWRPKASVISEARWVVMDSVSGLGKGTTVSDTRRYREGSAADRGIKTPGLHITSRSPKG